MDEIPPLPPGISEEDWRATPPAVQALVRAPGTEPISDPRAQAIGATAARLVELRDTWLNPPGASEAELKKRTLTNLYNERPTWLRLAHEKLDHAVLDAYGWPHDLADEQVLERLLALNLERAAAQGGAEAASSEGDGEGE